MDVWRHADSLSLPAGLTPIADACTAARWAALGPSDTWREELRKFDVELECGAAALAVQGWQIYKREWDRHSSITVSM